MLIIKILDILRIIFIIAYSIGISTTIYNIWTMAKLNDEASDSNNVSVKNVNEYINKRISTMNSLFEIPGGKR